MHKMMHSNRNRKLLMCLTVSLVLSSVRLSLAYTPSSPSSKPNKRSKSPPSLCATASFGVPQPGSGQPLIDFNEAVGRNTNSKRRSKRKYKRKRGIPETERHLYKMKQQWKQDYERIVNSAAVDGTIVPSLWSFESLFPAPVMDEASIKEDLYGARERDAATTTKRNKKGGPVASPLASVATSAIATGNTKANSGGVCTTDKAGGTSLGVKASAVASAEYSNSTALASIFAAATATLGPTLAPPPTRTANPDVAAVRAAPNTKVDRDLTRMVEDSMYGYRRTRDGQYQYDTSLMGDGAVQFRDGVRLGKPLRVNSDRLTYLAKKELQHGRVEEAQELYERAIVIDPQDGRAYLGLSRCAERRRDFTLARECLKAGITHSSTPPGRDGLEDRGANPFLLQALGCLEEKMGHLSEAEALYISAAKSRPWHAAAWVALAQLRTRKLGQSAEAGRVLFQAAERELATAGKKQSSHVYTAWASLEYKMAGDVRRARKLFNAALKIDRRCSAAYLQLGVMEADNRNWDEAQLCFDSVLKFDQRNSRVLQAYAIMETKRPGGDSRKAIGLFERALKSNPRDAGALQAYALFVVKLGDVQSARGLFRRATKVNKRHAAVWQAWAVLEMNEGNPEEARGIFQQGIWACAQLTGGQSGGYHCARLWQAWGLLEAQEGDYAAARRCFSRALDADNRNVATITAWALMEVDLGNTKDARMIFERALKQFAPGSEAKKGLWATYETLEMRLGNLHEAQRVYQRSMRETLTRAEVESSDDGSSGSTRQKKYARANPIELTVSTEFEVVRWDSEASSMRAEVWMNDRAIESRTPTSKKRKL